MKNTNLPSDKFNSDFYPSSFEPFIKYIEFVKVPGEDEMYKLSNGEIYDNLAVAVAEVKKNKKNLTKVDETVQFTEVKPLPSNVPVKDGKSKFSEKKEAKVSKGLPFFNNYTRKVAKENNCSLEEARIIIESRKKGK